MVGDATIEVLPTIPYVPLLCICTIDEAIQYAINVYQLAPFLCGPHSITMHIVPSELSAKLGNIVTAQRYRHYCTLDADNVATLYFLHDNLQ